MPKGSFLMQVRVFLCALIIIVSAALAPVHADPQNVLADRTFGGIGVDVSLEQGHLIVSRPLDGLPAARSGVRSGDEIVTIDGRPVDTSSLDTACRGLTGPVGSSVIIGVRRKGATQVDALTIERAPMVASAVTFNPVPSQVDEGVFQISFHVTDAAGQPLPGAHVQVCLDPGYTSAHFLFISTRIYLKNAAGFVVPEIAAVTDANGDATAWVRLGSATTPFRARLAATVTFQQASQGPVSSNVFTVYGRNH